MNHGLQDESQSINNNNIAKPHKKTITKQKYNLSIPNNQKMLINHTWITVSLLAEYLMRFRLFQLIKIPRLTLHFKNIQYKSMFKPSTESILLIISVNSVSQLSQRSAPYRHERAFSSYRVGIIIYKSTPSRLLWVLFYSWHMD